MRKFLNDVEMLIHFDISYYVIDNPIGLVAMNVSFVDSIVILA